ncbi:HEAT repeat domain-containing protein [Zunongwangia sp. SCSIO 43204]|uniref:HEAT repeat domain-containing protein n=1 Tax=Zunongwangia sp. SCSIO 43204 TaxID=2779359 RepID=UPI001CA9C07A|nr:HEAT repeat domain-containing protein [Zunongwangia sp. SCSIO 43204]UAB83761.1 HEAT repeat domain-containing protein [Zunongwangia sp. SCSIO 43204]
MAVVFSIDLQWIFGYFPDDLPFVIMVNIMMTIIFFVFAVLFVGFIILLRLYKIFRNRKKEEQRLLLEDILNNFLFDEEFDSENELRKFRNEHLNTPLEIKITIKEILLFHSNIKGESATQLRDLFLQWNLDEFCKKQLAARAWYSKSRALFSLSEMLIPVELEKIRPLLNHRQDEVRQQAQLYFIKLAENDPLEFLDHLDKPLTLWEEIFIEDALKNEYHGEIPDFSKLLQASQNSVVEFGIRMIAKFNQFENISELLPLLAHNAEEVRCEAVRSLSALEHQEVIDTLISIFGKETNLVKKTILDAIKHLGSYNDLIMLKDKIQDHEWDLKIKYYGIAQYFLPEQRQEIYNQYEKEKALLL